MSSRSRARPSWPLSICQPRRLPPNCSLAPSICTWLSPRPSSLPYSRRMVSACRRASRPSTSKPWPRSRKPALSRRTTGEAPGCGGGSSDKPASRSSAAFSAGCAQVGLRLQMQWRHLAGAEGTEVEAGDGQPAVHAGMRVVDLQRHVGQLQAVQRQRLAGPRLAAGHAVEQVIDVALAVGVALKVQRHATRRYAFDLDLALEEQRPQAQRQRRVLDAGKDLLRPAALGQAHALHGHCRLRPQLQRHGAVESQSTRMVGLHPGAGRALEVPGIEAEQQPRRQSRQQQQQGGQHVQASTPQGSHGDSARSAWRAFAGRIGILHDDCAIGRLRRGQRLALVPAGGARLVAVEGAWLPLRPVSRSCREQPRKRLRSR